jgi:hypothetical protein
MKVFFAWLFLAMLVVGVVDYVTFQFLTDTGDCILIFYPFTLYVIFLFTWKEVGFWHRINEFLMYIVGVSMLVSISDYSTFQILGKRGDTTMLAYAYGVGMLWIIFKNTFLIKLFEKEENNV